MAGNRKGGRMSAREIASAGAYGAVLIVIRFVFVALGALGPYVWLFATHPLMSIAVGPVFLLLVSKTKKPGAFVIIDLIFGLLMSGATWMIPVCMAIGGLLCELCLKRGKYSDGGWTWLGFFCFQAGLISEFFPLYFTKESYLEYVTKTMSADYARVLGSIITVPSFLLIVVLEIAGSLIGFFFGRRLMKKHFRKAGLG